MDSTWGERPTHWKETSILNLHFSLFNLSPVLREIIVCVTHTLKDRWQCLMSSKTLLVACFQILSLLTVSAVDLSLCQESVIWLATLPTEFPIANLGPSAHTHSCQTPRNQRELLGHSGPPPALCKWSQVPYMSLYLGPWQAARQVAGSEECGLVPGGKSRWLWPSQCGHTDMPMYACQPSNLQRCKQLWFRF